MKIKPECPFCKQVKYVSHIQSAGRRVMYNCNRCDKTFMGTTKGTGQTKLWLRQKREGVQ